MNLRELLGEELFTQVQEKMGNDVELLANNKKDNTYVPKSRLDTVLTQKKILSDKIDELEIKISEAQSDLSNVETLKTQLAEAQTKITNSREEVANIRRDSEIKFAIAKSGAKKHEFIAKLLDKDKVKFKEDGSIEGLDEQIQSLKTDLPELFAVATPPNPAGADPKADPKGKGEDDNKNPNQDPPAGGTGNPGNGGKGGGGKPESIGAKLAKQRVAKTSTNVDFFK